MGEGKYREEERASVVGGGGVCVRGKCSSPGHADSAEFHGD